MGSGKTTLIKAIGETMGVTGTMSSPTFSIVNEYTVPNKNKIYHFDLYRLKNEKEVMDIGAEEYFDSGELCLIEWPEKLGSLRPEHYFTVRISVSGPQHRKIEYQRS
jgi:tRNA threonylcarbamoyladenosine biosynthesis protein TsaE